MGVYDVNIGNSKTLSLVMQIALEIMDLFQELKHPKIKSFFSSQEYSVAKDSYILVCRIVCFSGEEINARYEYPSALLENLTSQEMFIKHNVDKIKRNLLQVSILE